MKKMISLMFALIITVFSFSSCKHNTEIYSNSIITYHTFEEMLKDSVEGIVIAEFETSEGVDKSGQYNYIFKNKETLYGNDLGNELIVKVRYADYIAYSDDGIVDAGSETINYKKGEEYILFLSIHRSVYNEDDKDQITIPPSLPYLPLSNLSQSTMYNEPLITHSQLTENDLNPDSLISYIKNIKKDDTKVYDGFDYIKSEKMEDIVIGSDYIVEIEVGEKIEYRDIDVIKYKGTILKSYKGDLPITGNEQNFRFIENNVKTGKRYILCLLRSEEEHIIYPAAKKFVYQVSDAEKIEEILKNAPAQ